MKKIVLFFLSFIFCFLSNIQFSYAISMEKQLTKDKNNLKEELNDSQKNQKTSESKEETKDIFGDEQTFPFVAGLGKNAAH